MFNANRYIRDQFRRYYPNASRIDVHFDETAEVWTVGVVTMGGHHIRTFKMEVGSDDDYYWFVNEANGNSLTIPFAPEQYPADDEPITANVTLGIHIDAYDMAGRNDTVDVSELIIELLTAGAESHDVVEHKSESLTLTMVRKGTFKRIEP